MKALSKNIIQNMSDAEKIECLIEELKCIKEIANYHYKNNGGSNPTKSGVEACTWITNEINGVLEVFR